MREALQEAIGDEDDDMNDNCSEDSIGYSTDDDNDNEENNVPVPMYTASGELMIT